MGNGQCKPEPVRDGRPRAGDGVDAAYSEARGPGMRRFHLALILAWMAGFVDATGFITLSHVFTSHMSGNTVAAAAHFGASQWQSIWHRVVPIPMFVMLKALSVIVFLEKHSGTCGKGPPSLILETGSAVCFTRGSGGR